MTDANGRESAVEPVDVVDPEDAEAIRAHYADLADVYGETVETPLREHLTWPTTRELLGDVAGDRALDAGCGPGHYAAELAADGAEVVGIDATEAMVERARASVGDRSSGATPGSGDGRNEAAGRVAAFECATVGERLPFPDDAFDAVLCQLVLSHVADLEPAFDEFARVLAPGGRLVVTTHHPFHDYLAVRDREYPDAEGWGMDLDPVVEAADDAPTYADTERFRIDWGGVRPSEARPGSADEWNESAGDGEGVPGTYYRRPLSGLLSPLLEAGFDLGAIEEPTPDEALLAEYPDVAEALARRVPEMLCLRGEV